MSIVSAQTTLSPSDKDGELWSFLPAGFRYKISSRCPPRPSSAGGFLTQNSKLNKKWFSEATIGLHPTVIAHCIIYLLVCTLLCLVGKHTWSSPLANKTPPTVALMKPLSAEWEGQQNEEGGSSTLLSCSYSTMILYI